MGGVYPLHKREGSLSLFRSRLFTPWTSLRYFSITSKSFDKESIRLEKSLVNNHFAINISAILKTNKSPFDMQIEIERFIFKNIHSSLLTKLKSSHSLNLNNISAIQNVINSASRAVDTLKKSNVLLRGKLYSTCFINTHTHLIISIIISHVIPHALKQVNIARQHVTALYLKIGLYLVREYNKTVYAEYLK